MYLVAQEVRVYGEKEEMMEDQEKLVSADLLEKLEFKENRVQLEQPAKTEQMEWTELQETRDPKEKEGKVARQGLRVSRDFPVDLVVRVPRDSGEAVDPWEVLDLMGKMENRVQMAYLVALAPLDSLDQRVKMVVPECLEGAVNVAIWDLVGHQAHQVLLDSPE